MLEKADIENRARILQEVMQYRDDHIDKLEMNQVGSNPYPVIHTPLSLTGGNLMQDRIWDLCVLILDKAGNQFTIRITAFDREMKLLPAELLIPTSIIPAILEDMKTLIPARRADGARHRDGAAADGLCGADGEGRAAGGVPCRGTLHHHGAVGHHPLPGTL